MIVNISLCQLARVAGQLYRSNLLCVKQTATYRAVAGTGCLGAMVLWLLVLQNVLPVNLPDVKSEFCLVTLAAIKLWHEPVSLRHWCGVAFVAVL